MNNKYKTKEQHKEHTILHKRVIVGEKIYDTETALIVAYHYHENKEVGLQLLGDINSPYSKQEGIPFSNVG